MGFSFQGVWVMGYCGLMGYGLQIPANQLGGPNFLWVIRGYGFSQASAKKEKDYMLLQYLISPIINIFNARDLWLKIGLGQTSGYVHVSQDRGLEAAI